MRLILAKLLFSFDLELVDKTQEWMKGQKVFALWDKPSLMVKLHARAALIEHVPTERLLNARSG
jgi:hypothetical protein